MSNPELYALVLRLRPAVGHLPPNPQGQGAQALFLNLVRQVDPELSAQLHNDAPSKPYSVALLASQDRQRDLPLDLRVAFTRAELFPPVSRGLLNQSSSTTLRLGSSALQLVDVYGTPNSHPWAGFTSFAELMQQARPAARITLQFQTATAFGQGTRSDGRTRLGLLPAPETVFGSLARRWNDLAPAPLALDLEQVALAASETFISRYQLESCQISLGRGPQKGFVGICSYEPPEVAAHSRLLALLADAAFYLGVGIKTARGMGLCRRLRS